VSNSCGQLTYQQHVSSEGVLLQRENALRKTVLAAALCRDQLVQDAFRDGIAWITSGAGKEPIRLESISLVKLLINP
jgi:hypothetical protein